MMATERELILRLRFENGASAELGRLRQGLNDLGDAAQRGGARGGAAFAKWGAAAADMSRKIADALVDFGADSIAKLADFRAEMAQVGKTTGMAGNQLNALGKDLRALAFDDLRGNVAANELANIAAAAGQLGVGGKDILAFSRDVAELSVALDLTADATATDMAKIANQFRASLEAPRAYYSASGELLGTFVKDAYAQIGNLGSAVNALSNTTTATGESIITMTKRMAGSGSAFKLTADQVAALSATMTDAGVGVERGSTAMNKMLGELSKNSDAFAATLKLDAAALANALQKDPMAAIQMVLKGMDDMQQHDGSKAMLLAVESLLGKGDGITQLALNLSSRYADLGKNAGVAAEAFRQGTSAHEEFLAQTDHTAARWDALKAKIGEFQMRVAEGLEPLTNLVTEWLNTGADWILQGFDSKIGAISAWFDEQAQTVHAGFDAMFGQQALQDVLAGNFGAALEGMSARVSAWAQASPFAPLVSAASLTVEQAQAQFANLVGTTQTVFAQIGQGDYSGAFATILTGIDAFVQQGISYFSSLLTQGQQMISNFAAQYADTPLGPALRQISDLTGNAVEVVKTLAEWGGKAWTALTVPQDVNTSFSALEAGLGGAVVVIGSVAEAANKAVDGFKQLGGFIGEMMAEDYTWEEVLGGLADMDMIDMLLPPNASQAVTTWLTETITQPLADWFTAQQAEFMKFVDGIAAKIDALPFIGGKKTSVDLDAQAALEQLQLLRNALGDQYAQTDGLKAQYQDVFRGLAAALAENEQPSDALKAKFTGLIEEMQRIAAVGWEQSVFPDLRDQLGQTQVSADGLNVNMTMVNKTLRQMGNDLQASASESAALFADLNAQQGVVNDMTASYDAMQQQLTKYQLQLKQISIALTEYRRELEQTDKSDKNKRASIAADIAALESKKSAIERQQLALKTNAEAAQIVLSQEKDALAGVKSAYQDAARSADEQSKKFTGLLSGMSAEAQTWMFTNDMASAKLKQLGIITNDATAALFEQEKAEWTVENAMKTKLATIEALAGKQDALTSKITASTQAIQQQTNAVQGWNALAGVSLTRSRAAAATPEDQTKMAEFDAIMAQKTQDDLRNQGFNTSVTQEEYLRRIGREDLLKFVWKHDGGLIRAYHAGGLAADEIPAILQTGEYVLSRADVQAVKSQQPDSVLRKVRGGRYHDGGAVAASSPQAAPSVINNHYHFPNAQVVDHAAFEAFVRRISQEQRRQGALKIS